MSQNSSAKRRPLTAGIVALCVAALTGAATAQTIDLSLNVYYSNPLDDQSGGTWEVLAKSGSSAGISALNIYLTGVANSTALPVGPRGIVNNGDPAGFAEYNHFNGNNYTNVIAAQLPVTGTLGTNEEQSVFYGVGTLEDGEPGDIGPLFTTLTNTQAIPWATGDPFGEMEWDVAAVLAAGTFDTGQLPSFFSNGEELMTSGLVYTSVGTSSMVGPTAAVTAVSTIVRDNLGASPDYNGNGVVDAADYTVWRDTLGHQGVGLAADGNLNGEVDEFDYEFWALNFGLVIPPGSGSTSLGGGATDQAGSGLISGPAVPEPTSLLSAVGATGILFLRRRFRHLRSPRTL